MLLVDDREKQPPPHETVERLAALDVPAKVERLTVSDFMFKDWENGLVLATRKASDLVDSFYSRHLAEEVNQCIKAVVSYGHGSVWFLLDGVWAPSLAGGKLNYYRRAGDDWFRKVREHGAAPTTLDAINISLAVVGVHFLPTTDVVRTLSVLYRKAQDGWPTTLTKGLAKPVIRPWQKDERVPRLMALWPHLKETLAVQLLKEYGSILGILQVVEDGTLKMPGIGKKGLDNLKAVALQ
jgi:ERCC4-type nuclease